MADRYYTLVTDSGTRKMLEAVNEKKKVNITEFAVGDGGGVFCTPSSGQTGLKNEVWRDKISACYISEESENLLIVESVIPSGVGGFTIREMGIFDDSGTLIAVCNTPDTQKVRVSDGVVHELNVSVELALSNTQSVELIIDPNIVTATKKDVENLGLEFKAQLDTLTTTAVIKKNIIIPVNGWAGTDEDEGKEGDLYIDIPLEGVTEDMVPIISILPADMDKAKTCALGATCRTVTGAIRFYAARQPDEEIHAELVLLCACSLTSGSVGGGLETPSHTYTLPTATKTRLGGVRIGDGVAVRDDGTISVDAAGVVDGVAATDEEVITVLDSVFGEQPIKNYNN